MKRDEWTKNEAKNEVGSYGLFKDILYSCTRLSRIDLVFRAFEALNLEKDLIDTNVWKTKMDTKVLRNIETTCTDTLQTYGYHPLLSAAG